MAVAKAIPEEQTVNWRWSMLTDASHLPSSTTPCLEPISAATCQGPHVVPWRNACPQQRGIDSSLEPNSFLLGTPQAFPCERRACLCRAVLSVLRQLPTSSGQRPAWMFSVGEASNMFEHSALARKLRHSLAHSDTVHMFEMCLNQRGVMLVHLALARRFGGRGGFLYERLGFGESGGPDLEQP